MTQQEKRIKLAEAEGWKIRTKRFKIRDRIAVGMRWEKKGHLICEVGIYGWGYNDVADPGVLPDYFNDLNAVHNAEKMLAHKLYDGSWLKELHRTVEGEEGLSCNLSCHHRATASQRAESIGLTLGLWKKGE